MFFEISDGSLDYTININDHRDHDSRIYMPGSYALISSANFDSDKKDNCHRTQYHYKKTRLTKRFTLEKDYQIISVDSIEGPAYAILDGSQCPITKTEWKDFQLRKWKEPELSNEKITGFTVLARDRWSELFYNIHNQR